MRNFQRKSKLRSHHESDRNSIMKKDIKKTHLVAR